MGAKKSKPQPSKPRLTLNPNYGMPQQKTGIIEVSPTFKYDTICVDTYPCIHNVFINGKVTSMNGREIYIYCVKNSIPVPNHFTCYYK